MSEFKFNEIYDTFQSKIERYLKRLVGVEEAEDITQEVFVKLNQGLKTFKGESQLSTWIYRIATNTAIDKLRSPSFQRMSNDFITEEELETEDATAWMGNKVLSVDQELIEKEMNQCIKKLIYNLPDNYRTVLLLSELEGFKNQEIANILNFTLDTVKIRLHRARAKLKKELERHCMFYHNEENDLACVPTPKTK